MVSALVRYCKQFKTYATVSALVRYCKQFKNHATDSALVRYCMQLKNHATVSALVRYCKQVKNHATVSALVRYCMQFKNHATVSALVRYSPGSNPRTTPRLSPCQVLTRKQFKNHATVTALVRYSPGSNPRISPGSQPLSGTHQEAIQEPRHGHSPCQVLTRKQSKNLSRVSALVRYSPGSNSRTTPRSQPLSGTHQEAIRESLQGLSPCQVLTRKQFKNHATISALVRYCKQFNNTPRSQPLSGTHQEAIQELRHGFSPFQVL